MDGHYIKWFMVLSIQALLPYGQM